MTQCSADAINEVRPRKDKRGVDLISDALPLRRVRYIQLSDPVDYAKFLQPGHMMLVMLNFRMWSACF